MLCHLATTSQSKNCYSCRLLLAFTITVLELALCRCSLHFCCQIQVYVHLDGLFVFLSFFSLAKQLFTYADSDTVVVAVVNVLMVLLKDCRKPHPHGDLSLMSP